jgi:predicted GTPase
MTLGTPTASAQHGLGARLAALARIVELGPGRVDAAFLNEAGQLLLRAGERLRLSADHTVVALAGGTGSGKSSLFNRISGLELSPTGVRRPTTARTHACVWGLEGAAPLLDWLQIQWRHRFARASALDRGEAQLHGLILLDLPDHDSIRALNDTEAERLIKLADLVVWVLDPQKYADASIHRRYLSELTGHEATTVFVLNQVDRLAPEELVECVGDLAELLKREGVEHPRLVSTSALTGRGVDGLKGVLAEAVSQRRAAVQRLEADLDRLLDDLIKAMPTPAATTIRPTVEPARREALIDALCDAVGLKAVGEAMENVYAARSMDWVGWPYAAWAARLRPDPLSSLRLGDLRGEIGELVGGSVTAQPTRCRPSPTTSPPGCPRRGARACAAPPGRRRATCRRRCPGSSPRSRRASTRCRAGGGPSRSGSTPSSRCSPPGSSGRAPSCCTACSAWDRPPASCWRTSRCCPGWG